MCSASFRWRFWNGWDDRSDRFAGRAVSVIFAWIPGRQRIKYPMARLDRPLRPAARVRRMPHHPLRLVGLFLLVLPMFTSAARGQNRDQKAPPNEDEMVARAAGRAAQVTTERDRLIRFVDRVAPRTDAFGPSPNREFDDWFDRLANGRSTWDRDTITRRPLTEMFDRMAERMNVTNGRMSRAQFHQYARKYLAEGSSPPWDSADDQTQSAADRLFEQLDRDHDGMLSGEEQPPGL